jgi:hypothetical protein
MSLLKTKKRSWPLNFFEKKRNLGLPLRDTRFAETLDEQRRGWL